MPRVPKPPMTRKPCPGCGEAKQREASKVCSSCQGLIKDGKDSRLAPADQKFYRLPYASYALPYFRNREPFQAAFHALILSMGPLQTVAVSTTENLIDECDPSYRPLGIALTAAQAEAFRAVHAAAQELSRQCFRDGLEKGQDLIGQLAAGELSLKQLNELSINKQ